MSRYAGFRSDYEAYWALFFETAGVAWKYEPKVYTDGVVYYLPDFWLPDQRVFFEVKYGSGGSSRDDEKKSLMLTGVTGKSLYVAWGAPTQHPQRLPDGGDICDLSHNNILLYSSDGTVGSGYAWCECRACGRLDIQLDGYVDLIDCACPKREAAARAHSTTLHVAYAAVAAELAKWIHIIPF